MSDQLKEHLDKKKAKDFCKEYLEIGREVKIYDVSATFLSYEERLGLIGYLAGELSKYRKGKGLFPYKKNRGSLYPELSKKGEEEAQQLIDKFREQMKKAAGDILDDLYIYIVPHIKSDSWLNFRNDLMAGMQNYQNRLIEEEYNFKIIRETIFQEFKDEIIKDLNQDLIKENEELKSYNKNLQESLQRRR